MSASQGDWNFTVERGPDCLVVRLSGQITLERGEIPLAERLWGIMQQHFTQRVVLDLSGVERLTGYAVRQLIALGTQICEHEGVMRICGLSWYDQGMLRRYGLRHRLPFYGDRAEALLGPDHVRDPQPVATADVRTAEWL